MIKTNVKPPILKVSAKNKTKGGLMSYVLLPIIGLFIMSLISPNLSANGNIFPYKIVNHKLENGLKVIFIPMESGGIVSYYTVVRTGSRDEWEPGKSGFAHFFEHMMFRGTKRHPGAMYDSLITSMGADANAYTTDDYTCYHLNISNEDLPRVIDLEADRFQNLAYTKEGFQTESGAVYGEYRKGRTSPFNVLWEDLKNTSFKKHTYKHTTIGYEKDIKDMPNLYDYSLSFYQRYYRPENCVVMVVGDFDQSKTLATIKKQYSSWAKGYTAPKIDAEPEQKGELKATVNYPGKTNPILTLAYKGLAFDPANKSSVAAQLFGDIAFGGNSALNKKLYLKEQKVQALQAEIDMNRDPFLWMVFAIINKDSDIEYVNTEITNTIEYYKTNLVTKENLDKVKKRMKYGFLMGLDTPDKVAGGLAKFIAITGSLDNLETYYKTLEAITPEDIQNTVKTYFVNNKKTTITLKGSSK
ncbi:MAG: M16 family metallopeptidase [Candidatus Kapaibacteriota bacterium]